MTSQTNHAPKTEWFSNVMACGIERRRLYVGGQETPFFIDIAPNAAHRTMGQKYGLWGAGMSEPHWLTKQRSAACLGAGKKIEPLKHRAEQMAMGV